MLINHGCDNDREFTCAAGERLLQQSERARALAADGWVYLEAPRAWTEDELAPLGLRLHRHLKAGAVHAHLLRAATAEERAAALSAAAAASTPTLTPTETSPGA